MTDDTVVSDLTRDDRAFLRVDQHTVRGDTVLKAGRWHHLAGVFDRWGLRLLAVEFLPSRDSQKTFAAFAGAFAVGAGILYFLNVV